MCIRLFIFTLSILLAATVLLGRVSSGNAPARQATTTPIPHVAPVIRLVISILLDSSFSEALPQFAGERTASTTERGTISRIIRDTLVRRWSPVPDVTRRRSCNSFPSFIDAPAAGLKSIKESGR